MKRKILTMLIVAAAPALGGCAVQAAMMAAELGPQIRAPLGASNAHLRPTAIQSCTQRAAQHGTVFIIDVEQRRRDTIIVWGSATDAQQQRRAFECHFTTRLSRFKLNAPVSGS
jgi:hypothetical protein